jgi:hypothetical protein
MSKKTSFANDCKEFQSAANLTSGPHMPSNGDLFFHLICLIIPSSPISKPASSFLSQDHSLIAE